MHPFDFLSQNSRTCILFFYHTERSEASHKKGIESARERESEGAMNEVIIFHSERSEASH